MSLVQGLEERRVTGVSQESGEQEEWEVATLLGQGGFGYVCALKKKSSDDQGEAAFPVIKSSVLPENFSRLETERNVLKRLAPKKSIPLCVDALQVSTLDSRVCALKLSARGVSIPKFLRSATPTQEAGCGGLFSSLVSALGPSIVEALRFAHEKMICHCDVRPPNLIIVPPPTIMAQIEGFEGDIAEQVVISRIDVSAETENGCYFLLNDWGEAETFRSKSAQFENLKKKDLKGLVYALASPEHLLRGSDVSSGSSRALRSEDGRFFLDAAVIAKLEALAESLNYDALSAAFKCVSFQDRESRS
jgi:serine/threonine protein kinase